VPASGVGARTWIPAFAGMTERALSGNGAIHQSNARCAPFCCAKLRAPYNDNPVYTAEGAGYFDFLCGRGCLRTYFSFSLSQKMNFSWRYESQAIFTPAMAR